MERLNDYHLSQLLNLYLLSKASVSKQQGLPIPTDISILMFFARITTLFIHIYYVLQRFNYLIGCCSYATRNASISFAMLERSAPT